MGTRGLTLIHDENGDMKIAQYGQWDHYSWRAGIFILEQLKYILNNSEAYGLFLESLEMCKFVDGEFVENLYVSEGIDVSNGMINMRDASRFKEKYPTIDRDMGYKILGFLVNCMSYRVSDSNESVVKYFENFDSIEDSIPVLNSYDFGYDSLFCEYVYEICLKSRKF